VPCLLPSRRRRLQATYDKALHLLDLYCQRGVDPKRLYIKVRGH
jgi:hypothetical protein